MARKEPSNDRYYDCHRVLITHKNRVEKRDFGSRKDAETCSKNFRKKGHPTFITKGLW